MSSWDPIYSDLASLDHGPGPLKLEKLRLKNMGVPAWTSQEVFDWACVKELRLPNREIDPAIWKDLQSAQLEVFGGRGLRASVCTNDRAIDLAVLSESLSFVRSQSSYIYTGTENWWAHGPSTMLMKVINEPSPLGPGTA